MSDLNKLTEQVREIYAEYESGGTNRWTYETALIDLSYQVGTLSKIMLQLRGDRFSESTVIELKNNLVTSLQMCWRKFFSLLTSLKSTFKKVGSKCSNLIGKRSQAV